MTIVRCFLYVQLIFQIELSMELEFLFLFGYIFHVTFSFMPMDGARNQWDDESTTFWDEDAKVQGILDTIDPDAEAISFFVER